MEPLFTNTCVYSKENLQAAMFAYNKRKKIQHSIIYLVLIFGFVYCFDITQNFLFLFVALSFFALVVYKYVYQVINTAKIMSDRNFVIYHAVPEQNTRFFDDRIELVSIMSKDDLSLDYQQINSVEQTKRLCVLYFNGKMMLILDKSKFENITLEEFERFIREKAPKANFSFDFIQKPKQ